MHEVIQLLGIIALFFAIVAVFCITHNVLLAAISTLKGRGVDSTNLFSRSEIGSTVPEPALAMAVVFCAIKLVSKYVWRKKRRNYPAKAPLQRPGLCVSA